MAIGMTYEQFWDGDAALAKAFREAHEIRQEQENFGAWLQGYYFYEALLDAAPALNGMSKRRKPYKYSAKPYDITGRSRKAENEQSGRAKMENGKAAMIRFAEAFNRSRKMKNGGDVNGK